MIYYRSVSPPDMRSLHLNRGLVGSLAALFLLAAAWLISERRAAKPISADEFVSAMETHKTSLIGRYFREHQNPNARTADDRPLLLVAISRGEHGLALKLLNSGASPDLADNVGITPLMVAAAQGNLEMVRALVGQVSDIAARDREGHSELENAVTAQRVEI